MVAFLLIFVALGRLYREMFRQAETRALALTAALIVGVGVLFYTRVEHWTVLNAIYFCVITLATVGYGDITPTTDLGKIFTIFYILIGLTVIGGFFATLGKLIHPGRVLRREEAVIAELQPPGSRQDAASTGQSQPTREDDPK
jgi:bacteriorhodopsin